MLPDLQSGRSEYKDLQSAAHCLGLKSVPRDSQAMATNSPPKLGGAGVVCLRQKWGILFASKPHPQPPPLWERGGELENAIHTAGGAAAPPKTLL